MEEFADPFLRFVGSLLAVASLVALVWKLGLGTMRASLGAEAALLAADHAFPGFAEAQVLLLAKQDAALVAGNTGKLALVFMHGAQPVARLVSSTRRATDGRYALHLEAAAVPIIIALESDQAVGPWEARLAALG